MKLFENNKSDYKYGSSIISTKLKYELNNPLLKHKRIDGQFLAEVEVHCGRKVIYKTCERFKDETIGNAIKKIFDKQIEDKCPFEKGKKYYAKFNIYRIKPIKRSIYKKTDETIDTTRRIYLFQERINIYF